MDSLFPFWVDSDLNWEATPASDELEEAAEILWGEGQVSDPRDQDRSTPVTAVMAGSALTQASQEHGDKLRDALSIPGRARWDDPSRLPWKHSASPGSRAMGTLSPGPSRRM